MRIKCKECKVEFDFTMKDIFKSNYKYETYKIVGDGVIKKTKESFVVCEQTIYDTIVTIHEQPCKSVNCPVCDNKNNLTDIGESKIIETKKGKRNGPAFANLGFN